LLPLLTIEQVSGSVFAFTLHREAIFNLISWRPVGWLKKTRVAPASSSFQQM
jgi:hypothetical protein